MKVQSLSIFFFLSLSPLWVSCGQFEGRLDRDYSFYIESDNQAMTTSVARLMQDFNKEYGKNVLKYEPNKSAAGSIIKLEPGIKARDNKIGWANYRVVRGFNHGKTTGNVRLDYDFVKENAGDESANIKLKTLLFHELGHVFGLGHTTQTTPHAESQVMWASINDEIKDFSSHFYLLHQAYDKDSPEDVVYGSYED